MARLWCSMHKRRLLILSLLILLIVLIAFSDALHRQVTDIVEWAEGVITRNPFWGMVLFILLAALSAMLLFFSSALIVPVGIYAWGEAGCFVLLWCGWLLGGVISYAVGRYLGRGVVTAFLAPEKLAYYEEHLAAQTPFLVVLLFQLSLPSEIPGYVLGMVRYRFMTYLAALALAELPFALGTVYLGTSFLQRQYGLMLLLGLGGLALVAWTFRQLQKRLS